MKDNEKGSLERILSFQTSETNASEPTFFLLSEEKRMRI